MIPECRSAELAFKRMPGEFTTKFWQVRDIRQLDGLHQLLVERFRQRGQSVNRLDTEYSGDAVSRGTVAGRTQDAAARRFLRILSYLIY